MPDIDEQWARAVDIFCEKQERPGSSTTPTKWRQNSTDATFMGRRTPDVQLAIYDFTSMYTTLPLQDLKSGLGKLAHSVY